MSEQTKGGVSGSVIDPKQANMLDLEPPRSGSGGLHTMLAVDWSVQVLGTGRLSQMTGTSWRSGS